MDSGPTMVTDAIWITSGAILLLLVMSAFFSGSETALTAASRGKLRSQADKGSRPAARVAGDVGQDGQVCQCLPWRADVIR